MDFSLQGRRCWGAARRKPKTCGPRFQFANPERSIAMPRNRSTWKYVVDPEYAEQVCPMLWCKTKSGYIHRSDGAKRIRQHDHVWFLAHGYWPTPGTIDHKNGVPWDNRISNLRATTLRGQSLNIRHRYRDLPTGVYGRGEKFMAMHCNRCLGSYDTPEEASAVYERARAEAIAAEETKACQSTVKR
jgi:hypothetical protein